MKFTDDDDSYKNSSIFVAEIKTIH